MNNRICPDELMLSEYLAGYSPPDERLLIEVHLSDCGNCRRLIADGYDVLKSEKRRNAIFDLVKRIQKDLWLIGSVAALCLSFALPRYFIQFLAAASLMGIKWIIDSRTSKMLITVYEALKGVREEDAKDSLSRASKKDL